MEMSVCWDAARGIALRDELPWDDLDGRTVLVTGATGLIGSQLVRVLLSRRDVTGSDTRVVALARNIKKGDALFGQRDGLQVVSWTSGEPFPDVSADCVVHASSPTSSRDFVSKPVDVIQAIVEGSIAALRYANAHSCSRVLLLSTMEIYGEVRGTIDEGMGGELDTMNPRSSYPEAKRLAECLFASYAAEYGTHTTVARLTQTFGEGVLPTDSRVFAEFARCATRGKNIVLLTDGSKQNQYLSVDDAVRAILVLLSRGRDGLAYNVANPETFCCVRNMANMVACELGDGKCHVTFGSDPERAETFRRGSTINLDISRLEALGWHPEQGLLEMYQNMISCWDI